VQKRVKRALPAALGLLGLCLIGFTALTAAKSPPAVASQPVVNPPVVPITLQNPSEPAPDLVIHEWGTFLSMSGSDGTALDGMYHEEHALPAFVHSRGKDQLRLPMMFLKGETPVIYFYTERPQSVRLGVGFPKGIWTHWYPQAIRVLPMMEERAISPERLANGRICWNADIIPVAMAGQAATINGSDCPMPPEVSEDALWKFSREVDAAYVKTSDGTADPARPEYDRFLFYRGLGEARLPLRVSARDGGTVTLDSNPAIAEGVRHIFVLNVDHGRAGYRYLPRIEPGQSLSGVIPGTGELEPLPEFTRKIADDLAARLTISGLYAKEARAMVNTWTNSYFQADGIRVLFVLPQRWTDSFIPMTVVPPPKEVVRVMVGRVELLSAEREQAAEAAVRGLADPDEAVRAQAFATLRAQGRYVEPIVRRVLRTSHDLRVQALCRRLLTTDEVTALRAAVHDAASGKMLNEDPLMLRALLARLLREVGLDREARSEGVSLLNALEKARGATPAQPERTELRAAALEASALDSSAAAVYEECIRKVASALGEQVPTAWVAWCREWWVGRSFASCHDRAGDLEKTASALEIKLSHADQAADLAETRLCRILLAHVRELQKKPAEAEVHWSGLRREKSREPAPRVAARSGS
jgi:hypothetical protein